MDAAFYFKDGKVAKTLSDLSAVLKDMSEDDFSHHVNESKNDFAEWTHHTIGDEGLAEKMRQCHTKEELLLVLDEIEMREKVNQGLEEYKHSSDEMSESLSQAGTGSGQDVSTPGLQEQESVDDKHVQEPGRIDAAQDNIVPHGAAAEKNSVEDEATDTKPAQASSEGHPIPEKKDSIMTGPRDKGITEPPDIDALKKEETSDTPSQGSASHDTATQSTGDSGTGDSMGHERHSPEDSALGSDPSINTDPIASNSTDSNIFPASNTSPTKIDSTPENLVEIGKSGSSPADKHDDKYHIIKKDDPVKVSEDVAKQVAKPDNHEADKKLADEVAKHKHDPRYFSLKEFIMGLALAFVLGFVVCGVLMKLFGLN